MAFLNQSDEILSVSEFSRRFKLAVKTAIPELWLRGEISNLKTYQSGHTYFTLKDDGGAISAVLFKGNMRGVSFPLREGMKVLLYGEVSIYEARSSYQIIVKAALPDGQGDLARRFEELKEKLSSEGLFDASSKKEIPRFVKNLAIISSPDGAAIRDFLSVLSRRNWKGGVYLLPSKVQGDGAAEEIVKMINFAQNFTFDSEKKNGFDLLVLARGGGSLEDLWCFNEEIVARSVASSKIPTISAIGHETDFTLSDFAADLRAETPTAAAEYISSAHLELSQSIAEISLEIERRVEFFLDRLSQKIEEAARALRLNSPSGKIENLKISVDEIASRINALTAERFFSIRHEFILLSHRLEIASPNSKIKNLKEKLNAVSKRLALLNPESAFDRGFSIALSEDGKILSSAADFEVGKKFVLKLGDGRVFSCVDDVLLENKNTQNQNRASK